MAQNIKDIKFNITFWQMFTIIVVAVVLGGVIYKFSYDNVLQDDIHSISFPVHKGDEAKTPLKR